MWAMFAIGVGLAAVPPAGAPPRQLDSGLGHSHAAASRPIPVAPLAALVDGPTPCVDSASLASADYLVLFDAVTTLASTDGNHVFAFANIHNKGIPKQKEVEWLVAQLQTVPAADASILEPQLASHARALSLEATNRWISSKGQSVVAVLLYDAGATPKTVFNESARDEHIVSDIATLAQLVGKLPVARGGARNAPPECTAKIYSFKQQRANLTVVATATPQKGADSAAVVTAQAAAVRARASAHTSDSLALVRAPEVAVQSAALSRRTDSIASVAAIKAAASTATAPVPDTLRASIVTGPRETLFLSANAGVSSASQVTYDASSKALGPAQTPKSFLIAANWSVFQDLYSDTKAKDLGLDEFVQMGKQLYLGAFVEGSTKPLNQLGFLVGFRWVPYVSDVVSLATVSPYVGVVKARNDVLKASGGQPSSVSSQFGPAKLAVGLSLNLSQAMKWVGGASGSTKGSGGS